MFEASITPEQAIQVQKELRHKVRLEPYNRPIKLIGGADVSFNKYSSTIYAGFVVLDFESLKVIDSASAIVDVKFPYVPGLLSFREIPPLLEAWKNLKTKPDVIVFDGQGIAHPRRLGIASHAGLILDIPSIGCAKSLLTGVYEEPDMEVGEMSDLVDKKTQEKIGVVLRTKDRVNPVFISPGHRMDFDSAVGIIRKCVRKHRIPEPTRQAHLFVNQVRLSYMESRKSPGSSPSL